MSVAILLATFLASGQLKAGDITETDSYVGPKLINYASWNTELTVPQFDPSQGVLKNVTIELTGSSDGLIGFGKGTAGAVAVSGDVGARITLQLPVAGSLVVRPRGAFSGTVPGPGSVTFDHLTGTDYAWGMPDDLSPFIGTGTVVFPTQADASSNVVFGPGAGGTFWGWEVNAEVLLVVTYEYSTAAEALDDVHELIAELDVGDFSNANQQNALGNKVDSVIAKIDAGDLTSLSEAIDKLMHDILPKTDGKNRPPDWVVDPQAQQELEARINAILDALRAELAAQGGGP